MNEYVLDSSAVLAFLNEETGAERVFAILDQAYVSTANIAEVYTKLTERGIAIGPATSELRDSIAGILLFTDEMAHLAGSLRLQTQ